MVKDLFIQKKYRQSFSFTHLRMQKTCQCSLEKWELNNLSDPFWRWYCNDRSGAFVVIDKTTFELNPKRIFLVPPYTNFSSRTRNPIKQLYMHFSLDSQRTPLPCTVYSHIVTPEEKLLRARLIRALEKDGTGVEMEISFLSQILVNLALKNIPLRHWQGQLPDRRVEAAIQMMQETAFKALPKQDLAHKIGMSVNAFTRTFKKATGHTPHQYLLRLRLEKARQLLQNSDASLEDISEQAGFYDRFHFSHVFQRHYRTGPAAFRRRIQEHPMKTPS